MNTLNTSAEDFMKSEFAKAQLDVLENENGRKGTDFMIKTEGNTHELYLKVIDLDAERSIKIPKQALGELKDSLWIALVMFIDNQATVLYLIPSKIFLAPDGHIFKSNDLMLEHLSNWEINVFTNAIPELSKYALGNMVDEL